MADEYLDDDETGTGQEPAKDEQSEFRRNQRALEKRSKERDEAIARATAAERELAFYRAGVNLDHPAATYFTKAYDGDMDVEKVKEAAEKAGLLVTVGAGASEETASAPAASDPRTAAEAASLSAIQAATSTPDGRGVNHFDGMEKAAREAMEAGRAPEDAIAAYMLANGLPTVADDQ